METIEREFDQSQERSWARRQAQKDRRTNWWIFWGVLVIGGWVIMALIVFGVVQF